jgi:hypothetical protein
MTHRDLCRNEGASSLTLDTPYESSRISRARSVRLEPSGGMRTVPDGITLDDLHERLIRETLGSEINDRQAYLIFSLFHTHQIELTGPIVNDCPEIVIIPAMTQRHCSEILASFWPETSDVRGNYVHWYWKWNTDWNSGENLTEDDTECLRQLIEQLEGHAFISRIVYED